jgi:anti-sigma regulatory factor (Ser/Thr protein kinase)
MTADNQIEAPGFVHSAMIYRSEDEYLAGIMPFVDGGLDLGQPVMIVVPGNNLAVVRGALGDKAADVVLRDMTEIGRNPSRIVGNVANFAAKHPYQRVRMVGEMVWPGRSAAEYPACVQVEAWSNTALESCSVTALCPYDAGQLDESVVVDACATHPLVQQDGSPSIPSPGYAPDEAIARYNQPLSHGKAAETYTVGEFAELSAARSFAADYANRVGLSRDGVVDLHLIATELATNSLQHAAAACRLALWQHDEHLICEARDNGQLDDPLAGHWPPTPDATSGRGLFLVNSMADLVRTHTSAAGTTIQVYLRLDPSSGGKKGTA